MVATKKTSSKPKTASKTAQPTKNTAAKKTAAKKPAAKKPAAKKPAAKKPAAKKSAQAKKAVTTKATPAKKSAAKTAAKSGLPLNGLEIVFDTYLAKADSRHLAARIEQLGGELASAVTEDTAFVVCLQSHGNGKAVSQAKKLNAKGASVEVMTDHELCQRYPLSQPEVLALLEEGKTGHEKLKSFIEYRYRVARFEPPKLRGAKLEGLSLASTHLSLSFDECKLKGADLRGASISELTRCDLRDAQLGHAYVGDLEGSDCRGTDVRNTSCRKLAGTDLRKLDLHEVDWRDVDFSNAKMNGVNLARAALHQGKLAGAVLAGADLRGADLSDADLTGCDLRRAKLTGANLGGAKLKDASLEGADFTDANLTGASLPDPLPEGVRGLDPESRGKQAQGRADGPKLSALDAVARTAKRIKMTGQVKLPDGGAVTLEIDAGRDRHGTRTTIRQNNRYQGGWEDSLAKAMLALVRRFGHGELQIESIRQQSSDSPIKGKDLLGIVVDAWCESWGVESPHAGQEAEGNAIGAASLGDLTTPEGMKKLNATLQEMTADDKRFTTLDFGGLKLDGLIAEDVDLSLCRFKLATLSNAQFTRCKLSHAVFEGAKLKDVVFADCPLNGTNWSGAKLTDVAMSNCDLAECTLVGAKFERVALSGSVIDTKNVRGSSFTACDLSGANLSGLAPGPSFKGGKFDGATRFPPQFNLPDDMEGPREKDGSQAGAQSSMDLPTFMARLRATVYARDLEKALKMLRGSSFHLYSMIDDDQVVSIVKSPSDPKRFYACRLGQDVHSCGTQRLNRCSVCGRGPCKHMLVMIVGLARAGQVDLTKLDAWVQTSMSRYADFDKDQLADLFLRYSNAQAGEIDWRPTETIPEDYYSI